MMGKIKIISGLLFSLAFGSGALADFSFSCGEGKDKGPQQAELGLLDSMDSSMKFYIKGEEVADEKLGLKPTESGLWIATIDEGEGKGTRTFEFSQMNSNVHEFFTDAKGKTKRVGAAKTCAYKSWEAKPE